MNGKFSRVSGSKYREILSEIDRIHLALMMGVHHAATGAAAWVALTSTLHSVPALGAVPMAPLEVAIGAMICAGAALVPDADHPRATIAHSFGLLSKAATRAVSASSGGHRNGTHSGISTIIVLYLAWLFTDQGWIDTSPRSPYVVGAALIGTVMLAFAFKVLRIAKKWPMAWVLGASLAGLITGQFVELWAWLPLSIAVGWITHLIGDFLTVGGLPLFWPLSPKPPRWLGKTELWSRGGYFALPLLGRAGSWREWALCVPVSLYAIFGITANFVAALPFVGLV